MKTNTVRTQPLTAVIIRFSSIHGETLAQKCNKKQNLACFFGGAVINQERLMVARAYGIQLNSVRQSKV